MDKKLRIGVAALALAVALGATGCTRVELSPGDFGYIPRSESNPASSSESVELLDAEEAQVSIRMGAGELSVDSGAGLKRLMEAEFEWFHDELRPTISHNASGGHAELTIEQVDEGMTLWPSGQVRSIWEIALSDTVPIDLEIDLGAGEADLLLGELNLSDLDVDLGAGRVTIDLAGVDYDLNADINAGVGELELRVPADIGVRVSGRNAGLGDFKADGFTGDGDSWINPAWDGSETQLDIDLNRGVGTVTLELVD